ncbi:hypothetical protein EIK77_008797 [Talaromyces pinophilus]|nr:hypothetical protein EIK77_008797 [Talaromyces pinophilus]
MQSMKQKTNSFTFFGGMILLDEPNSKVLLVLKEDNTAGIAVDMVHNIEGPSPLWSGQTTQRESLFWAGMLSIQSFAKRRFRDLSINDEKSIRAFVQIIPHALRIIKQSLRILPHGQMSPFLSSEASASPRLTSESSSYSYSFRINGNSLQELSGANPIESDRSGTSQRMFPPDEYAAFAPSYWPSESDIYSVFGLFFNLNQMPEKLPITLDGDILTLPYVSAYVTELEKMCQCRRCSRDASKFETCAIDLFKSSVVTLTRDILAISIFDSTESILVAANWRLSEPPCLLPFKEAVNNILFGNGDGGCTVTEIFDSLLFLIGHDTSEEMHDRINRGIHWIASAGRGQVVYPIYLENAGLISSDLLRLGGGPGDIIYDNMRHTLVATHSIEFFASVTLHENVPVRGPRNLIPDDSLEWRIIKQDGYLQLGFGITSTSIKMFNPMKAIWAASQSLFISSCPHSGEPDGEVFDSHSIYITPRYEAGASAIRMRPAELALKTVVVGVAGNERLRFFALAGGSPAIIAQKACMHCCIKICRLTGYTHVIA